MLRGEFAGRNSSRNSCCRCTGAASGIPSRCASSKVSSFLPYCESKERIRLELRRNWGDAQQHLAVHYSEFRTRHTDVTSFHLSPTARVAICKSTLRKRGNICAVER